MAKSTGWLRGIIVALALFCSLYYAWTAFRPIVPTQFDDAYMFTRYAKHYLSGHGFSWNISDGPSYGCSSPLHLLLITALRSSSSLDDGVLLTATSIVVGLLSWVALIALGFLALDDGEARRSWLPLLVIPRLATSDLYLFHSTSGMETTLSMLMNTLLICAVIWCCKKPSTARVAMCVAASALSFLTRPDNGIYCLLFPPLFLLASDRSQTKRAAMYLGAFLAFLCLDAGLMKMLFGDAIPLSFHAKHSGFYLGYLGAHNWNPIRFIFEFLEDTLPALLLFAAICSRREWRKYAAIFVPVVLTIGYFFTVNQIMGSSARYYYPSFPYVVLAAWLAVSAWEGRSAAPAPVRSIAARAVLGICLLLLLTNHEQRKAAIEYYQHHWIKPSEMYTPHLTYVAKAGHTPSRAGFWHGMNDFVGLVRKMPPNIVLAASEYGFIGAQLPDNDILDLVGLHDRRFARQGFSAGYLFSRQPDLILLPPADYSYTFSQIVDSPEFVQDYEYYPGLYVYGIALRKSSPRFVEMQKALADEFKRILPKRSLTDYLAAPPANAGP